MFYFNRIATAPIMVTTIINRRYCFSFIILTSLTPAKSPIKIAGNNLKLINKVSAEMVSQTKR